MDPPQSEKGTHDPESSNSPPPEAIVIPDGGFVAWRTIFGA
jgi:hypothetical protein